MAATAISIDAAASGLLRHRFVRAFTASVFVGLSAMFIASYFLTMPQSLRDPETLKGGPLVMALVVVAVAAFLVFGFSMMVAAFVALGTFVHRRVIGFVMLVLAVPAFLFCVIGGLAFVSQELGLMPRTPVRSEFAPWQEWLMAATFVFAGAILFETIGWAWWQTRIARGEFFAARGWRAPPWRVYSTTRQTLGMPSFISNFGRGRVVLTFVYFLVAVLNLGLVAMLAIPIALIAPDRGQDLTQPILFALAMAGLVILNGVGIGALLQGFAAQRASRLYQKARDWDGRPPIVFLRAFDQDAQKLKAHSIDPFVRFPAGCGEARTLDELLLENASVYGPVIAIGDPRDPTPPLGAARIFVPGEGNEWQHVVTSLLGASSAVVMCPSTSEGVKWELDLISDAIGRLKVIFLANPLLSTEQTHALFQRLAPGGVYPELKQNQAPIAAFVDGQGNWVLLTTKKPASVQTYTVALNYALQALLGMKGTPLSKEHRRSAAARSKAPRAEAA
jgi:hypothetical protein